MSVIDWIAYMIGIDLTLYPEYDYLIVASSCALLIIFVSSLYTMLMVLGGIVSHRRS